MPWFALDDGFDTHPKVRKAGNAAAGLFCRLGAHCAKHLTEGLVDASTVRDYGTAATVRKLVEVGMLHPFGHGCDRCEQPTDGGYVMHDFLDYNKSRKQVEAAREHGRKRQQKGRDQARQNDKPRKFEPKLNSNSRQFEASLASNAAQNEGRFPEGTAGQGHVSHRDTLKGGTGVPSHPIPSPPSPTEKEQASKTREHGIPEQARPLVDSLTAAGVIVRWPFHGNEWFPLLALISRTGIPAMVDHATKVASRTSVESAKYFLNGWAELPPLPPPGDGRPALRTVDTPRPPLSPQAARRNESRNLLDNLAAQLRATGGTQ